MKKLFIAILMLFALTGCVPNSSESIVSKDTPSMFVRVEEGFSWDVYYHRDTKVMYAVSDGVKNSGTFTVLVNPDGTPMLWEE